MRELSPLFIRAIAMLQSIPQGRVATYASISELIGAPGCARHISFILNSSSKKYQLPWHRVINSQGKVSAHGNSSRQVALLKSENIVFKDGSINLLNFQWKPPRRTVQRILKDLPKHTPIHLR